MFREIRRSDRKLSEQEAREILSRAEHGVLATVGADGWPYAVPVNHVLSGNSIYIHSATEGHKLDNIAAGDRVSYCAVATAKVVPETLSTVYESAVAFGHARLLCDPAEKREALELLTRRFCVPPVAAHSAMEKWFERTAVIRIDLTRITGKARRP